MQCVAFRLKIRLVTVYRPSEYTVDDVATALLLADLLADIMKVYFSLCVIGDFNINCYRPIGRAPTAPGLCHTFP